ncbi:MAG: NADH-quinone oxidoreductase subunit NuoH [Bacteroidetes bacterium]|jgi:NADH-quinone oxidoreductase subunit H|nr:NADH-quinone oxidoreductase subunit NuoH [Bacteroidota bacterium]MDA0943294.1 NADH-quinone oxidoreductase subunit NuoH [Bacteroidota bacterium]MDA1111092.1 NADH-quinone oxidoreductase subunit NuoH [Bacteroidota bacterium]
MDAALLIEKSVFVLILTAITLGMAAYMTYGERKIAAFFQDRIGPDRAGPFGVLQPLADAGKLFFKEELIPKNSERWMFILGPGLAMVTACITSAVIPWGDTLPIGDRLVSLQVADINIGVLYIVGIVSIGVYGIMIGGWASNNKYSLFGAIRASAQMISYELSMGLALIAVIMMSGTLSLKEIVEQQQGLNWNIWYQPLGFIIFFTCALAECNRAPFDMAECETELIGGYNVEYSSMKLGFYLFAEYINMFVSSALMATVYLGGYNFPGLDLIANPTLLAVAQIAVMFAKVIFFIFVFMWIRWTLPRFRYDQLMHLGWKGLIPLAIVNMLLTGAVMLFLA